MDNNLNKPRKTALGLMYDFVKKRIGPNSLLKMLKDRQTTESYLLDSDSNLRCAALLLLMDHWKCHDERFATTCEEMALSDPDIQVRALALSIIGTYYHGSNDCRIGNLLASITINDAIDLKMRESAYRSLFCIRGFPCREWPPPVNFDFFRDVDWQFVESFFEESEKEREKGEREKGKEKGTA